MKLPTVLKHHLCIFVMNSLPISFCYPKNNKEVIYEKFRDFPQKFLQDRKGKELHLKKVTKM